MSATLKVFFCNRQDGPRNSNSLLPIVRFLSLTACIEPGFFQAIFCPSAFLLGMSYFEFFLQISFEILPENHVVVARLKE